MSFLGSTSLSAAAPKIGSAFSVFKNPKEPKKEKVEVVAAKVFSKDEKAAFFRDFEACREDLIAKRKELNEAAISFELAPLHRHFENMGKIGEELKVITAKCKALFDIAYDAGCFPDCFDPEKDVVEVATVVSGPSLNLNDID